MTDVSFRYNGLVGWQKPVLKECATCGILFETAQRTKKYCSASCSPRNRKRKTDGFVSQITVLECIKCGDRRTERVLVMESTKVVSSNYLCDECLRDLPVIVLFGEST